MSGTPRGNTVPLQVGRSLIGICSSEGVECTVLVFHDDVASVQPVLVALCHMASTIISIKPLNTGTSAEIEAQLDIFRRKNSSFSGLIRPRLGYSEHTVPR